jgi:ParB-like chromosome segregation protein Spo0J
MAGEIKEIELNRFRPNGFNPRLDFDNEELNLLAQNIKEIKLGTYRELLMRMETCKS